MAASLRLSELAERFGLTLAGDDREVSGVARLEDAGPDQLAFLSNPKYAHLLASTGAGALIVPPSAAEGLRVPALVTDNPYLAVARIAQLFAVPQGRFAGVSPQAYVHESAHVDEGVDIAPFVYVGEGARIGAGSRLFPGVYIGEEATVGRGTTLMPNVSVMAGCSVGSGCTLHPGVVVGSDGFGYAQSPEGHVKVPQTGPAIVEDGVEVGANTCIDRGSFGTTRVGMGAKIDNLVQLAHNVTVGPFSIVVAQAGIAGSTSLGQGVVLAGQVGVNGHVHIGDGAQVAAQSGVRVDIEPGGKVMGSPAVDAQDHFRVQAAMKKLPEYLKRVRRLEKELSKLSETTREGK